MCSAFQRRPDQRVTTFSSLYREIVGTRCRPCGPARHNDIGPNSGKAKGAETPNRWLESVRLELTLFTIVRTTRTPYHGVSRSTAGLDACRGCEGEELDKGASPTRGPYFPLHEPR